MAGEVIGAEKVKKTATAGLTGAGIGLVFGGFVILGFSLDWKTVLGEF